MSPSETSHRSLADVFGFRRTASNEALLSRESHGASAPALGKANAAPTVEDTFTGSEQARAAPRESRIEPPAGQGARRGQKESGFDPRTLSQRTGRALSALFSSARPAPAGTQEAMNAATPWAPTSQRPMFGSRAAGAHHETQALSRRAGRRLAPLFRRPEEAETRGQATTATQSAAHDNDTSRPSP